MSVLQISWLLGLGAIGVVLAAVLPRHTGQPQKGRDLPALGMLAGVTLALLIVGVVSGTVQRHIIQTAPLALAFVLVATGSRYGLVAAAPMFAFWFGIMVTIWLYLLGLVRIFGGTFDAAEIGLTLAIGVSSAGGLVVFSRRPTILRTGARLLASGVFAALQVAALFLSM
jgi:hypothetical protein